jgi:hypothetical protein
LKTTELFAEQVLIGFLVLGIGGLVFKDQVIYFLECLAAKDKGVLGEILAGGVLLGAAYLIGIVYDRIADTLLQNLEAHYRIHFALEKLDTCHKRAKFAVPVSPNDPFPEDRYRIHILKSKEATDYMEYLRSRIRLTRALATLIPGMSVALLLALSSEKSRWWYVTAISIPTAYALVLLSRMVEFKGMKRYRPPRTNHFESLEGYMARGKLRITDAEEAKSILWYVWPDELWLALLLLITIAAIQIFVGGSVQQLLLLTTGILVTWVVGWSWWRILRTYFAFLKNYEKHNLKESE